MTYHWTNTTQCTIGRAVEPVGILPLGTNIACEYVERDDVLSSVLFGIAAILSFLYLIILLIAVAYRKTPVIGNAQPLFIILMPFGGILGNAAVFLLPGEPSYARCAGPVVLVCFGFTMLFGCLLLKTYRIYRIFVNSAMSDVKLSDVRMMKTLGVFLVSFMTVTCRLHARYMPVT